MNSFSWPPYTCWLFRSTVGVPNTNLPGAASASTAIFTRHADVVFVGHDALEAAAFAVVVSIFACDHVHDFGISAFERTACRAPTPPLPLSSVTCEAIDFGLPVHGPHLLTNSAPSVYCSRPSITPVLVIEGVSGLRYSRVARRARKLRGIRTAGHERIRLAMLGAAAQPDIRSCIARRSIRRSTATR